MKQKAYLDRVMRLKARTIATVPEIDLEGARLLTEGFMETEGEPWVMQKAKAFRKQCLEKTCYILPDELIVGSHASKPRAGTLCADASSSILEDEFDTISTRRYDPFIFKDEDKKLFKDFIEPYWRGKAGYDLWKKQKPKECRLLTDDDALYIDRKIVRCPGDTSAGFKQVIDEGIEGIIERIKERKSRLNLMDHDDWERNNYLDAMLVAAEGCCAIGPRYAEEARRQAAETTDEKRKNELLKIAEVCDRVPAKPARNFWEAVQSMWMYHELYFMEQGAAAYSIGRADQFLYPYYKADIDAGRITPDEAQELLDCCWVKFAEQCQMNSASSAEVTAGYLPFTNISCGGINKDGEDAVNDVSYMMLQATAEVQMYQPSLSVRYNVSRNPDKFLRAIVELMKLGTGFPSFHNDLMGMKMIMSKGVPAKEAWNWTPGGCVETYLEGRTRCLTGFSDINLGKMVEYALLNGHSGKDGHFVTVESGDPTTFTSYQEFEDAVMEQIKFGVRAQVKGSFVNDDIFEQTRPTPVLSLSFPHCIESGKDYMWGGAEFNCGDGCMFVGLADLVNSLYAVKHLVFDEKKLTMAQMIDACKANFEGYEDIVQDHLDLPEMVKEDVLAVYGMIAEAESHAHGVPVTEIHFHEVGTMDALADISAVCLLLHKLVPEQVIASPVCVGSGQVQCAHGILPVPTPATAYLLQGIPAYSGDIKKELCTPTGAALLKRFVSRFGGMPVMTTQAIGYGMGTKKFDAANCIRAFWCETAELCRNLDET